MKFKQVLEYLRGTMDEVMVLGADSMEFLQTWVDTSYAVHPDTRSHTGGCMLFRMGAFLAMSRK